MDRAKEKIPITNKPTFKDIEKETEKKIHDLVLIIKDNFAKKVLEIEEIVRNARADVENSSGGVLQPTIECSCSYLRPFSHST